MGLLDRGVPRTITAAAVVGLLMLAAACTVEADDGAGAPTSTTTSVAGLGEPTAAASAAPAYFFSQNARSGTYRTTSDGVELVLDDVADVTVAITERPNRGATHLRTADFVADWDDQFGDDPPNATIAVVAADGTQSEAALELLRPTYDPDARRLTYPARVLTGGLPDAFVDASVMIDDAGFPVHLNVIDQTDDVDGVAVVLYRPNLLGSVEQDVAWTILELQGPGDSQQLTLGALSVGATDSFGDQTAQLSANPGSSFQVVDDSSGTTLVATASSGTEQISISSGLGQGVLDAEVYENGKLLSVATGVMPGNTAVFRYASSIWIGSASQFVQGEIMQGEPSDATELDLEGVASADLVVTGGGGQPYSFTLQNVTS